MNGIDQTFHRAVVILGIQVGFGASVVPPGATPEIGTVVCTGDVIVYVIAGEHVATVAGHSITYKRPVRKCTTQEIKNDVIWSLYIALI